MTTIIDRNKMTELLDEAVAARGADFNYHEHFGLRSGGACDYKVRNEPGCIIGWVLNHLGLLDMAREGRTASQVMGDINSAPNEFFFTDEARAMANNAQLAQDNSNNWGPSVQAAKEGLILGFGGGNL